MKTLHLSIIIFSFALAPILYEFVSGSDPCPESGYVHYGPSRQSIPCYLVTPQYNPTLEEQFGNPTQTKLVHDGAILILNQTTQKLAYKMGENITIIPELINTGNKTVTVGYCEPLVAFEIKNQAGDEVWPKSQLGCVPELTGKKTLQPGEHLSVQPWGLTAPDTFSPPRLSIPGNYTVVSVALFTFGTNTNRLDSIEPLWSKPLQITVLPELSSVTTLVTGNQTTNQSSLQEQLDLAKQKTEGEYIGGPGMSPTEQKLIKEKENNQTLILVLAIGIPAIVASVTFLIWKNRQQS